MNKQHVLRKGRLTVRTTVAAEAVRLRAAGWVDAEVAAERAAARKARRRKTEDAPAPAPQA